MDDDDLFLEAGGGSELGAEEIPTTHFPNVYVFVQNFLAVVYARPVSDQNSAFRWCRVWFEHPEAVARLESLWKAFESLRLDPGTGGAVWWRDYADPTMAALTQSAGPFWKCSASKHAVPEALPMAEAPEWLLHSGASGGADGELF